MFNPAEFPNVAREGYAKTSEQSFAYNCIAWAANDQTRWWWPSGKTALGNEAYWPKKVPRTRSLNAFTKLFKELGYEISRNDDGSFEPGFEKVAIYVDAGGPTHAARQLDTGEWTHKVGANIDCSATLEAFAGGSYGTVVRILKRKRRPISPMSGTVPGQGT